MNTNRKLAFKLAGEVLLPALALVDINNQISSLVWDILKEADGVLRYEYYTIMLTRTYLSNHTLMSKMIEIFEETKAWNRRLSIETVKQNAR
jgi:hypothetical protein